MFEKSIWVWNGELNVALRITHISLTIHHHLSERGWEKSNKWASAVFSYFAFESNMIFGATINAVWYCETLQYMFRNAIKFKHPGKLSCCPTNSQCNTGTSEEVYVRSSESIPLSYSTDLSYIISTSLVN